MYTRDIDRDSAGQRDCSKVQEQLLGDRASGAAAGAGVAAAAQPELEPEFQAWLRGQGIITQPLVLRQCGREGRGLVADRPLGRGEALLQLPDSLLLTPQRAAEESCLAPLLRQLSPAGASTSAAGAAALPLPEWSLLALYLAELRGRAAAGDRGSRWAAYVDMLPQRPGTVLDWPAKETRQLLRGSPLLRLADSIAAAAAASWEELAPLIARGRAEGLVPAHVSLSKADLDWAFGVLLSRCIRLPGRDQLQVLAPWADLLNHDVNAETGAAAAGAAGSGATGSGASGSGGCHLDWEPTARGGAGALVLRTDRAYAAGQQVYVSYGPKSSGELLLSYGFCPPPAANPHQDYKLLVGVNDSAAADPLAALKAEVLAKHGLPPSLEFPLKLEGLPAGLLNYLAFVEAAPQVPQELHDLGSLLFEEGVFPLLDGADTLAAALKSLGNRCTAALKAYPTTMEVDQALAAGAAAAVVNRSPRGPRGRASPTAATATGAAAAAAAAAAATATAGGDGLVTLGTEDVSVSVLREAAVAGIRVRERQILQRTQASAIAQLAEVKRAARSRRR
eukprot:XP_001690988.1 lysine N-methylase [Chlamydomonas reinhardtii]